MILSLSWDSNSIFFGCVFFSLSWDSNSIFFGHVIPSLSRDNNSIFFGRMFPSFLWDSNSAFFGRVIPSLSSNNHHQSVLLKGRSLTASAGTWVAVLPKAGLPPQTQEPRLQFYQGLNRFGSFPLLSAPSLSLSLFSIWQKLKDLKRSQEHQHGGEESEFG